MRPALAIIIWIAVIGGLAAYMQSREQPRSAASYELPQAEGVFALEITTTFPAEPDPFALQTGHSVPPALLTMLNGKEVLRRVHRVEAGVPIRVEPVAGLLRGRNEFYLEANPPLGLANLSHAVRVRLLRDGQAVIERSIWSEPGHKVAMTFEVDLEMRPPMEGRSHG